MGLCVFDKALPGSEYASRLRESLNSFFRMSGGFVDLGNAIGMEVHKLGLQVAVHVA